MNVKFYQILSLYRKLKYDFKDEHLQKAKDKFNLSGNRFEVLRTLDEYLRNHSSLKAIA